jgi:TonB family protein
MRFPTLICACVVLTGVGRPAPAQSLNSDDHTKICSIGALRNSLGLSSDASAASGVLFMKLCSTSIDALVDLDDMRWDGHITRPVQDFSKTIVLPPQHPPKSKTEGKVSVAYIVEVDGRVTWDSVLESSGDDDTDQEVLALVKGFTYKRAAMLDGMPVRAYATTIIGHSQNR